MACRAGYQTSRLQSETRVESLKTPSSSQHQDHEEFSAYQQIQPIPIDYLWLAGG
jgi:hypothetical protein